MTRRRLPVPKRKLQSEFNELLAYATLLDHPGEWVGAVELADSIRYKYRPLAFALRRLARKGLVEEKVVWVRGTARSKEMTRRYRRWPEGHISEPATVWEIFDRQIRRTAAPATGAGRPV